MQVIYVKIDGISCDNCRNKITKELLKINNITDVRIVKNIAKITTTTKIDEVKIVNVINSLGYFTQKDYISTNIIEFTPKKVGVYSMNCWMNMLTNKIKVVDDEKYFEVKK